MAETKSNLEREYIIPLRREYMKVPRYERTGKAIKAIKKFIAKHMKVPERDIDKVKIDKYFNNEIWSRGRKSPPAKIRVKARKEGDIIKVDFVEIPEYVKFLKSKNEKFHKKPDVKEAKKEIPVPVEQSPEGKKDEVEKEKATEIQNIKQAEQMAKAQKHTTKFEKAKRPTRMALEK